MLYILPLSRKRLGWPKNIYYWKKCYFVFLSQQKGSLQSKKKKVGVYRKYFFKAGFSLILLCWPRGHWKLNERSAVLGQRADENATNLTFTGEDLRLMRVNGELTPHSASSQVWADGNGKRKGSWKGNVVW